MVSFFVFIFKMIILFLAWLWLKFIGYIEWFDAAALVFISYLIMWHNNFSDNIAIGVGVVVGVAFLLVFKTRIGWWISTGVFSLMWAYLAGELSKGLFHVNTIVYWIIIAVAFGYCVWLHYYAKWRKWSEEQVAAEEAAARHP